MAGNKQNKKSSFSVLNMFKSRRPRRWEDSWDEVGNRNWPSDEDKGYWVAEPGIDRKASAFIAKFHEARFSESEHHSVQASNA